LKGNKADTLAKGHAKSIAEKNDTETKAESGMSIFAFLRLQLSYMVGLTLSTVVENEGLIMSSKRRPKPTVKVMGVDPLSTAIGKNPKASSNKPRKADAETEDDEETEPSTTYQALLLNFP
jgi:hypothetical protein